MCGIVGYLGHRNAVPILIKGLKRLEYRGYDSAGLAVLNQGHLTSVKKAGKVRDLEAVLGSRPCSGTIGIAHTRWATHGEPNDINAHPHSDQTGKIALIHNGIIENYGSLGQALRNQGITFVSETDTEVLVQLISAIYNDNGLSFSEAVRSALQEVVGAYGIVTVCEDEPNSLVAARLGSPLVLGVGDNEYFLASDASPIVEYTRDVIYLDEGEIVTVTTDGYTVRKIKDDRIVSRPTTKINLSVEEIEKGNFPHFMLKEIYEQERTIKDTMRGRLQVAAGTAFLGGIREYLPKIEKAHRFYITACGTSWHAGLIGKHLLEEFAGIPVHVEYASEFRYRKTIVDADTLVIAISQSGETADTLAAIRKAHQNGALVMGICNVVGSSIARETDFGVYTHAGPEIGVASTKAFTAQVTVLLMLALLLGRRCGMSATDGDAIVRALDSIDTLVRATLDNVPAIEECARENKDADNFLYLGRGLNFPIALEGALKCKEISYIHAEGYPAAEMKHGPIALIDEKMPVVVIAPHDQTFDKIISNIREVKARRGRIIAVTDKRCPELTAVSDFIIEVGDMHPMVFPIVAVIPLQILAYYLAVMRGCNVDQPRNLAKSVTVE
ncbi:MAG: glutamine--fructose-6-phosphate transaminase (isomerizing) [Candidatus Neomarinimicrobiota bacterium]